jgi:hypothetical protein
LARGLVLTQPFDVWWKDRMNLFIDERTKVLKPSEEWDENSNFIHLCVDKRRRIDDIR